MLGFIKNHCFKSLEGVYSAYMEASQEPPTPSQPKAIELQVPFDMPIEPERARLIWLMNHALHTETNPETTEGGW